MKRKKWHDLLVVLGTRLLETQHPEVVHDPGQDWTSYGWHHEALFCRICSMQFFYRLPISPGAFGSNPDWVQIEKHIEEHGDGSK